MAVGNPDDAKWMQKALELGRQGIGLTSPNPPVGAVVVSDQGLVGEGWHRKAGGPHAEVCAIRDARSKFGDGATAGATIYVTLEPCSTHGRTPPCVEAIIEAGLKRVVVGTSDPNPHHRGAGYGLLEEAGIRVDVGICEQASRELIRFFARRITSGLPWVIAKTASTLDGKTTLPEGEGQWISGTQSRKDVQRLRRMCDAVMVGGGTFIKDNPALTLRGEFAKDRLQPLRVVLTSRSQWPESHQLLSDEFSDRTRIHQGITLRESLGRLADEGVNAVLLESGGRLLSHALAENLVDELVLYLAPRLGGGEKSLIPVADLSARLEDLKVDLLDRDIRLSGRVARHEDFG
ncbi:MAG: bifunctional diaminohydroxyphosphoribosylaminopyrimidine deaminase/5-amino-6-(5-phosphoribosylamino)uracil reductase RibD [Verrucomicrobiota bacterium]